MVGEWGGDLRPPPMLPLTLLPFCDYSYTQHRDCPFNAFNMAHLCSACWLLQFLCESFLALGWAFVLQAHWQVIKSPAIHF
jgi:hypothetical protein